MINAVKLIDHLFILTTDGPSDASQLILFYILEIHMGNGLCRFDAPSAAAMHSMSDALNLRLFAP